MPDGNVGSSFVRLPVEETPIAPVGTLRNSSKSHSPVAEHKSSQGGRGARAPRHHAPRQSVKLDVTEVPDDRRRFIYKAMTGKNGPHEHMVVFAAATRNSGAERLIKAAQLVERAPGHREIRARAEHARGVGIKGRIIAVLGEVEDSPLMKQSVGAALVEVELHRVVKRAGRQEAGHASHVVGPPETTHDGIEPPLIDPHVVVGKRNNVAASLATPRFLAKDVPCLDSRT